MKFTCPRCGGNILSQVIPTSVVARDVEIVFEDGEIKVVGKSAGLPTDNSQAFFCGECGLPLRDSGDELIRSPEVLADMYCEDD